MAQEAPGKTKSGIHFYPGKSFLTSNQIGNCASPRRRLKLPYLFEYLSKHSSRQAYFYGGAAGSASR